jgi:CRISPR-associated protein Cmr6
LALQHFLLLPLAFANGYKNVTPNGVFKNHFVTLFISRSLEDKAVAKDQFFHKKGKNLALLNTQFQPQKEDTFFEKGQHIQLTTTYPGLIIGSGYGHQTGTTSEFKLGFFFDHTTGLPIIPGSSVKGLLRSYFPAFDKAENILNLKKEPTEKQKIKAAYIYSIWKNKAFDIADKDKECAWKTAHRLELSIFEGIEMSFLNGEIDLNNPNVAYLPISKRDIFHDAFISKGDKGNQLFGEDSITPHDKKGLKNPVPVAFMKILPDVTFQFNFDLKDTTCFSKKRKSALFESILKTIGIGAKTNVGYGQLEVVPSSLLKPIVSKDVKAEVVKVETKGKAQLLCKLPDGSTKTIPINAFEVFSYKVGGEITLMPRKDNLKEYEIKK